MGIMRSGIDKSQVNCSKLTMVPPSPEVELLDTSVLSPPEARRDSREYYKQKLERAEEVIAALRDRKVGPNESGILQVDAAALEKNEPGTRDLRIWLV